MPHAHYDEDEKPEKQKPLKEWDCPDCNANNPMSDPIKNGDEIRCNYCGEEYKVAFTEGGKIKLKAL